MLTRNYRGPRDTLTLRRPTASGPKVEKTPIAVRERSYEGRDPSRPQP